MTLGNLPKLGEDAVVGKYYWRLGIGVNAMPSRYFSDGWRGFEFIIYKPYESQKPGNIHPYLFRLAFAYWLPITFF